MQMGGSDQWGNIVTGTELIRRKAGGEAFAFTCPLLTKSDGGKFGKTEKGNIWLDPAKTSPYRFYQFWLRASDDDAKKWIKIFTFLSKEAIEALIAEHDEDPGKYLLQKTLAKEITIFVHGEAGYAKALETTAKLNDKSIPASALTREDLEDMDGVELFNYDNEKLAQGIDVVSFLAESGIFPSKGEARKMVQNGGVSINRAKVDNIQLKVDGSLLLHDQYMLIQKGKNNFYLVKAV
jgi:tyrosyl-tRNA synthetase